MSDKERRKRLREVLFTPRKGSFSHPAAQRDRSRESCTSGRVSGIRREIAHREKGKRERERKDVGVEGICRGSKLHMVSNQTDESTRTARNANRRKRSNHAVR